MHATKLGLIACVIGIVATTAWADDFTTDTAGRWRHRVRQGNIDEPAYNAQNSATTANPNTYANPDEIDNSSYGNFQVSDMVVSNGLLHVPFPIAPAESTGILSRTTSLRLRNTGGPGPNPADTNAPPWWNDGSNYAYYTNDLLGGGLAGRQIQFRFAVDTSRPNGSAFALSDFWGDYITADQRAIGNVHPGPDASIQLAFFGTNSGAYIWLGPSISIRSMQDGVFTNLDVMLVATSSWANIFDGSSATASTGNVTAFNAAVADVRGWTVYFRSGYRYEGWGFCTSSGVTSAEFQVDYLRTYPTARPAPRRQMMIQVR